tara:strand:- start:80 stop:352 length:273 start_codon:yes stop_codon:yes gene_type:complete
MGGTTLVGGGTVGVGVGIGVAVGVAVGGPGVGVGVGIGVAVGVGVGDEHATFSLRACPFCTVGILPSFTQTSYSMSVNKVPLCTTLAQSL